MSSFIYDEKYASGFEKRKLIQNLNASDYFIYSKFNKQNNTKYTRYCLGLSGLECLSKNIYKPHGLPFSYGKNGDPKPSHLRSVINVSELPNKSQNSVITFGICC
jgi:hypothetical protein